MKKYRNLIDLYNNFPSEVFQGAMKWKDMMEIEYFSSLYVDNNKLDGFIGFFYENSCEPDCEGCGYCEKWVEKAWILTRKPLKNIKVNCN